MTRNSWLLWTALLVTSSLAFSQAKPEPDSILFTNGEKVIGKFIRAVNGNVVFHSETIGDITVPWAKIKELKAAGTYAVVGKGNDLTKAQADQVPKGTLAMADQKIELTAKAGEKKTIPVAETGHIVDESTFGNAVRKPSFLELWNGTATGGASLVQATQASRTFNGGISLVRSLPGESFLERQSRTIVNISGAFGNTRQPGSPSVKTEIYHADFEQDKYFSARFFAFGQAAFDHNYSQGLDLQQTYGGGIGWTVTKSAIAELNVKASAGFKEQQFLGNGQSQNLFGSIFNQTYARKLGKSHGILFQQQITLSPAWNNLSAYSLTASAGVTAPLYKRLSFSFGSTDGFVNNPPTGFKKNSFQVTTGITYVLK